MSNLEKAKHVDEAAPVAKVKEEICQESRIDAPRVFSEKEILDAIQATLRPEDETGLMAKIRSFLKEIFSDEPSKPEKGQPSPLKISRIVKDNSGNIVALDAVAPCPGGIGKNIQISYVIQGKHGQNSSSGTTVMHRGNDLSGKPISGENVSEFKGGKWVNMR